MILETSWEVCNKMGGIYTVLSSRAKQMMQTHGGNVIFFGPRHVGSGALPHDFIAQCPPILESWMTNVVPKLSIPVYAGQWDIPGTPPAILIDFRSLWNEKGAIYYDIWKTYGIESDKGYGDYDECSLFSVAAARVMDSLHTHLHQQYPEQWVAIFNEWQTAMGLLYCKEHTPQLGTMFITHATTVGRSIAGNGKALYAYLPMYNGDQMSQELNVEAKHAIEKRAAHEADCFTSVSDLMATECEQLLGKRTDIITPNGFEPGFVPQGKAYDQRRAEGKEALLQAASALTGQHHTANNTFMVALSGRYEYRNKGIDVFIQALNAYRHKYQSDKTVLAFVLVPAWVEQPRADLKYLLQNPSEFQAQPLLHPMLTHWLFNMEQDMVVNQIRNMGIQNLPDDKLKVFFVPCYLNGIDGIFNKSYYDILIGMDLTVFPSYYEPWGYTPLESIAFGIPTITSNFTGFGLWAQHEQHAQALQIVERSDFNTDDCVQNIADHLYQYCTGANGTADTLKEQSQRLAERAEWTHFYQFYLKAYDIVAQNVTKRTK